MSMFGVGGGFSKSDYDNKAGQHVFKPQADALRQLYGHSLGMYEAQNPLMQTLYGAGYNQVNPFMQGLNPYMMQGFGGLMGGGQQGQFAQQMSPELQASLQQSLGPQGPSNAQRMYQDIVGGEGNTYVDPLVDDMYNQAWKGLDRGAFKNSAQSAAARGNMGNYSRQMDNAAYAADTMSDVRSKEMALRAGAYDQDMNWKMDIANMADSNAMNERMNAQNSLMGQFGAADQNSQFALNSGQGMQQFGMNMFNPYMTMMQAPWMQLSNLSGIIGDPTVLGYSDQSGGSFGMDGEVSFM